MTIIISILQLNTLELQKLGNLTYIHSGVCGLTGIRTRPVGLQSLYSPLVST